MKLIIFTFSLFLFWSCASKSYTNKEKLLQYINDPEHGLTKELRSGVMDYKITYKPTDLMIEQDLKTNHKYKTDSLKNVYSDCMYFVLSVSKDSSDLLNHKGPNFENLLKTLSFGLNDKIALTEKTTKNTFYLNDYMYPRMYGSSRSTSILLCFKDPGLKDVTDFTISVSDFLNDSPYKLKFEFNSQDLKNTPSLKL